MPCRCPLCSTFRAACAVAVVVLAACTHAAPELRPEERRWGAAVRQAWEKRGDLPSPDRGDWCDVRHWSIRYPGKCTDQSAYGCLRWEGVRMLQRERPVVHVNGWWHVEHTIVQHELLHAYEQCSGLRDWRDEMHRDPRIWEKGGPESVQLRARELLTPDPPP